MTYQATVPGIFISRPNRFIAHVEVDGVEAIAHVKNTGRCRELLIPGAHVILSVSDSPTRKTKYDLIAVYKGDILINMDSQAPNAVFGEWVRAGKFGEWPAVRPECKFGGSRFDFFLENGDRRAFVEVKGVTLEQDGTVLFPDAPTERGVKHLYELIEAKKQGYDTYIFFVIQLSPCRYFTPNAATHPAFAEALRLARDAGVQILAYDCCVTENSLAIGESVPVVL